MKKTLSLLLALLLCLALCACGGDDKAAETPAADVTSEPSPTKAPEAAPTVEPTAEPVPTEAPVEESNDKEVALSLIDSPIEDLYAAIGEPATPGEYASSCLIDGEDGVLYYDGFTVYTLRYPDGTETVYHVE